MNRQTSVSTSKCDKLGFTTSSEKHATASTRCVKDNPSTLPKYPYAARNDSGLLDVIVSRDETGGVNSNAIHPNWSQPTDFHTEQDNTVNLVPAKLEVAKDDCNTTISPGVDATRVVVNIGLQLRPQKKPKPHLS